LPAGWNGEIEFAIDNLDNLEGGRGEGGEEEGKKEEGKRGRERGGVYSE
jgi:hypothetical protein